MTTPTKLQEERGHDIYRLLNMPDRTTYARYFGSREEARSAKRKAERDHNVKGLVICRGEDHPNGPSDNRAKITYGRDTPR